MISERKYHAPHTRDRRRRSRATDNAGMKRTLSLSLLAVVLAFASLSTGGCAEIIIGAADAGLREARDHGKHPKYKKQSYGSHWIDSVSEQLTDDDCSRCHRSRCCC